MFLSSLARPVALVSLAGAAAAPAQIATAPAVEAGAIAIGRAFDLRSRVLGDTRRINVYLPDHYSDPKRRFPVLFLLDGGEREDFHHISAIAQITAAYGEGEELIVVGIQGVDRRHDLTSPSAVAADLKRAPTAGGAASYRRFLTEELKPWVAAHFRTDGRTALIGESLAGLFVLETLLKQPEAFDDYVAVSPSLWWNGGRLIEDARVDLRKTGFAGRRLWLAFETPPPPAAEAAKDRARQAALERAFRASPPAGFKWSVMHSKEGHSSIYHPAALQAVRWLYRARPEVKPSP